MHYPIAIEIGTESSAWGIIVPDLPGCFCAGDTLDESLALATEAAAAWIETALDDHLPIPPPSPLESLLKRKEFAGWTFGILQLDLDLMDDKIERINMTLPRRVLRRLDAQAKAAGQSRSGFVASLVVGR